MNESMRINSPKSPKISMQVTPGHFATNNSHVSHYLDFTALQSDAVSAKEVAVELAAPYLMQHLIETVVCMEGTETIGTFLADDLLQNGGMSMNRDGTIHVVIPTYTTNGQLIFQENMREWITDKNIILLVTSVSSAKTVLRALDCLSYYGGTLTGVSALFSAVPEIDGHEIHSIFSPNDIDGYETIRPDHCDRCKQGVKLDAIINYRGYMKL